MLNRLYSLVVLVICLPLALVIAPIDAIRKELYSGYRLLRDEVFS